MKKKLKLALPKDEAEICEKGFKGNISGDKEYVTDGHSLFLVSDARSDLIFKSAKCWWGKPPVKASIELTWNTARDRKNISAYFIGVCKPFGKDSDIVLAIIRDNKQRIIVVNPYILQFAAISVQADAIEVSEGDDFSKSSMALLRDGKLVALVMPMRYGVADLEGYDLTGPDMPLTGDGDGKQVED